MTSFSIPPTSLPDARDAARAWLVRRQGEGWNARDESEFQRWLAQSSAHAAAYAQCEQRWRELDAMPADLQQRLRESLARDKARQAAFNAVPQFAPTRRRFILWPATSAAVAMVGGGAGYMAWEHLQAQPLSVEAFHTERGQQQTVTLSDGSQIRMDTATQLEVRMYRRRREVQLREGQAMFMVQHDGRPFHVLAGPTRVSVVGTRFAVRYTPSIAGNDGVQVEVEEGRVRVAALAPGEAAAGMYDMQAGVLLSAGQQVAANAHGAPLSVDAVPAEGVARWRAQRISFVDVPLSQALAEFDRYHATGLRIAAPQVAAMRLSGTFDPMATAALYQALPRVLPVRLQRQNDGVTVVTKK